MLRRTFSLFLLALFTLSPLHAEEFSEGIEYDVLKSPVKTSNPDKVVVTEVFWYGCPHCFRLEPYMLQWKKTMPEGVELEIVPSVLNRTWQNHARAYYALQMMGVDEQMHAKIFNAIHLRNQRLDTAQSMADFVAKQGLDEKKFLEFFQSFPVDSKLRKNKQIERKYGHRGVPAIIVNGKYLTSASRAGSNAQMLKVVDYLVQQELAQR